MTRSKILIGLALLTLASHVSAETPLLNTPASHKTYIRKAHAQINYLAKEIQSAERNFSHVNSAYKAECQETLKHLRQKEQLARAQLDALKKASNDRWPILRKQEDALLVRIQKSYQHLINRYFK